MGVNEPLDVLFNPRSVAVIGASNDWNKWGNSTFVSLQGHFRGPIYPINRREKEVLGQPAFASVLDVPGPIDLAVFVIPAEHVPAVMRECVQKGVRAGIVIAAGFRETGPQGQALEDEVLAIARQGGLRFVGPNCMGLWSASADLSAFMFPLPCSDGPVAFISQGGNVGASIVASAHERGLGLRAYVSCGPAADIQLEDYIEYFAADEAVKVIMLYIEGLADGQRFLHKVSHASRIKPVIVFKPGASPAAARAILSHSGSLAGRDEIFASAMKKAGVIRVASPDEMLDVAVGLLTQPLPAGRNVGIITGGGSYGVICAEDCAQRGLNVADLPPQTISDLSGIFPPRWSRGNPVDPAGDRNFIAYYLAPRILLELDEFDALVFMGFGSLAGISSMFGEDGPQIFVNRIPEMLAGLEGIDELLQLAVTALQGDDLAPFRELAEPMMPFIAPLFGSDAATVAAFLDILLLSDATRRSLVDMLELIPAIAAGGDDVLERIFDFFDYMIGVLLADYMRTYGKPIISTTFHETPQPIKAGAHPYTSSARATTVLLKLVEYREYLEKYSAFESPFQCCALLGGREAP